MIQEIKQGDYLGDAIVTSHEGHQSVIAVFITLHSSLITASRPFTIFRSLLITASRPWTLDLGLAPTIHYLPFTLHRALDLGLWTLDFGLAPTIYRFLPLTP